MQNVIEQLKKEHEAIELELDELEFIRTNSPINYSNVAHVLKKLIKIWDPHEEKEEKFFNELKKKNYEIPYEQILFAHGVLRKYRKELEKGLHSGSEEKMRIALEKSGKELIVSLKEHIRRILLSL